MFIKRSDWERLERRVAALETALGMDTTAEERRRREELERQFDALWNYDGKLKRVER